MHLKRARVPNTLGVPCKAEELVKVDSRDALARRLDAADANGQPVTLIGGGSNIVLRRRLPGITMLLALRGISFEPLGGGVWRVRAAAGETWTDLVRRTLAEGIRGLENLVEIPGSVGAAPYQNIGAYGRELSEVLESVDAYDREAGCFRKLAASDCAFAYRDSRFKSTDAGRFVVTGISLRLGNQSVEAGYADVARELGELKGEPTPSAVADAVTRIRAGKLPDPNRIGNVGSFFRNPVLSEAAVDALRGKLAMQAWPHEGRMKVSAARLIDCAGWRGREFGAVGVWPRQPLVLVNRGGATGSEVLDVAERIRDDVRRKYDVLLETEPVVAGVD